MPKYVNTTVPDQALSYIKTYGSTDGGYLSILNDSTITTSWTWAEVHSSTRAGLGRTGLASSDFTIAAGTGTYGRKVTVGTQSNISIHTAGTATHVAVITSSTGGAGAGAILFVTTLSSPQAVSAGNTATVNSFAYDLTWS